jgi:translocation and assembly module TamB
MAASAPILEDPPPPGTRARRRWFLRVLVGFVVVFVLACIAAAWLFTTTGGAKLVLSQVTRAAGGGIRYEGVEGSIGGPMRIKLIEVDRPDMYARIEDFEMDASPWAPLTGRLAVHRLEAGKVEVRTVSTGAAAQVPVGFAPPYAVLLERGHVGMLRLGALTREAAAEKDPVRKRALMDASAKTDLVVRDILLRGEGDQAMWKIDEASAATPYGKGKLAGTLQTRAPFALDAKLAADGVAAERPWRADIVAKGTLTAIDATLAGEVSGQPATGRVRVEPFATQPVRTLELAARDVDLSRHASGPRTRLGVEVNLTADSKAFAGPVRIVNAEPGPWDREQLPFASANARVVITAERVDVHDLDVALAGGGTAAGRASLTRAGAEADLRVAAVNLAALHGALQKTSVTGRISMAGDRAAQRFELALKDPRFEIEGRAGLAGERLDIDTVTVRTGGGAVTAKGDVLISGKREFRLAGDARHFDPSAFVKTAKGDLNFTFTASGQASPAIAGEARLDIAPSTVSGLATSGRVAIAGDRQRIASLDMDLAVGDGRASARGSFGRAGDAMEVAFNAPNLSIIGKPLGVPLAGSLRGEGRLTGTFRSPAGRLAVNGANLALPSNVYVRELAARLEAGVEPSSPIDGSMSAKGVAIGEDKPPTPLAQTATVTLKGTRGEHRLELVAEMRRDTTVRALLEGGLDPKARTVAWNGRIASLAMTGRGAFALTQPATLSAAADRVELGDAMLKGEWGEARFAVTRWTPRTLEAKGSSAGIQIQNFARSFRFTTVPRSSLVVAVDWDVRAAERLDATASLKRVSGDLRVGEPPLPLGLSELQAKVEIAGGRARGNVLLVGERVGRVAGEGTGTVERGKEGWDLAPAAPVSARLVAEHTNLEALAPWLGPDSKVGGRLNATVIVDGTGADPRVGGTASAVDLLLREPQTGFELERGTIALRMSGKSVAIERFEAFTPWRPSEAARERMRRVEIPPEGGKLSAVGSIDLAARTGAISIKVDKVPVTQLPTRFLALSGETRLEAGAKEVLVTGALKADAGWIGALVTPLPSVAEDVVVVRAAAPAPAEEEPPREPIRIDLKLSAGDRLYFQGRGLDTRLAGDVHLTGTPGAGGLKATGTIRTAGGTYDGYGQKLTIERGVLTFQGALDNPRLNVLALRKGLPVEAGVEVLGTTSRPRVRLVSVPEVPEPEKLSWLVLGRGASDASLGDSALMVAAARALLGGNNPGSDITKKLGFDEIKIGRADTGVLGVLPQSTVAGRTGTPSAAEVVTVGRRLNRQLYLTYEQGLADAEGALKLAWRVTRQFQVLARAGYLPGLDAVYRWSFP